MQHKNTEPEIELRKYTNQSTNAIEESELDKTKKNTWQFPTHIPTHAPIIRSRVFFLPGTWTEYNSLPPQHWIHTERLVTSSA